MSLGRAGKRESPGGATNKSLDDVGQGPANSSSKATGKQFSISHYMVFVAMAPFSPLVVC